MIRTFRTHTVRKTEELSGSLWDFRFIGEGSETAEKRRVCVPSCWETYPGLENRRGKGSYARTFQGGGNLRLEFKGVSHTARVFVDGRQVASHYNAYTPFSTVLKNIPKGEHTLEVIADNSFGPDSALHIPNDYQSYGGITRGVVLEKLDEAYIRWIHFTPRFFAGEGEKGEGLWKGEAQICLCSVSDRPVSGTLELWLEENRTARPVARMSVELKAGEEKQLKTGLLSFPGVSVWSPENPALYLLSAVLKDEEGKTRDDLIERVGFREVKTEGRHILLNGKKLRIKGFCRHEDHPQFGCALPFEAIQYDLMMMKELGANSVRTSHYPNDERFLDLCDEQGILVWEENHARGLSEENMRNPHFEQQCEDCIREMIENHYNHPSIYIWGILNECASHTEYGRECYAKQYALIRQLDSSRPRSSASCQFKTDICLDLPEVVSYNIYPKWYHDTPVREYLDDLSRWVWEETEGAGKPFLITETGAGAIYGYRTPARVKWSEEYQEQTLEEQIRAALEKEGCSGIYIWQYCDVRVCDSWFSTRPRTMNNKGVVDEYRRPKLSFETVKRLYRSVGNYFD